MLGIGYYSKSRFGIVQPTDTNRLIQPVAVNSIKDECDDQLTTRQQQIEALRVEYNTLAYLQIRSQERAHPNIIRLIGVTTSIIDELYLLVEYCEYGSLAVYLRDKHENDQFVNEIDGDFRNKRGKVIWNVNTNNF